MMHEVFIKLPRSAYQNMTCLQWYNIAFNNITI
jgi:hypothetical protein